MLCRAVVCALLLASYSIAQSSVVSTTPAASVTNKYLATLTHGVVVTDLTIMGTVQRRAGSDNETGAIVAQALATGESRVDFNYNSGRRSESRAILAGKPVREKWSDAGAAEHDVVSHNVVPLSPWFSPAMLLQTVEHSRDIMVANAGTEQRAGQAVEHLTVTKQVRALHHPAVMLSLLQKAARMELYVSSSTGLPVALTYNSHPDKNLAEDIPVEIRFADYRTVNGVQIPFQIKKYFNRSLQLDIQLTSVTVNSGLSASSLQLQ